VTGATTVGAEQVLAFRIAQQGLASRRPLSLSRAAACPASDFARGSALLAVAARSEGVTREGYDRATDTGELVIAPALRAAIHAVAPGDFALYGRALIAENDAELGEQLGTQLRRKLDAEGITPGDALREVADATSAALADARALTKDELHEELRGRVRPELLPWCRGCGSHHVAPMLWRFGCVRSGVRCDAGRRFLLDEPGEAPDPAEAVRRFLHFYGPGTEREFAAWGGLARAHARHLWSQVLPDLVEVRVDGRRAWLLGTDEPALAAPPRARGVRLLPPRDPYLQHPDRTAVAPDPDVRKRLFRPVAGPGGVLQGGRLAGLWRVRARGRHAEIEVEELERIDRDELEAEAARVAELRGAASVGIACDDFSPFPQSQEP
jgi:hypothetical protein